MLSIARCFAQGHQVSIFWNPAEKNEIVQRAKKRFDFDLSPFLFTPNIFSPDTPFIKRFIASREFDRIILLSDGSIPFLACPTIVHFQSPVEWVQTTVKTKIKLARIKKFVSNSQFTKTYIDRKFGIESAVIYPPVSIPEKKIIKKQKCILNVGRFGINHTGSSYKKQEVLLKAFLDMVDSGLTNWELVFVMSVKQADQEKLSEITQAAKNYPVRFIINPENTELWKAYEQASIYWHASGFGENLEKHPDRAEHFGISTVEAMGMGAVPIVINAGGQKEIVTHKETGFLWNTIDELITYTKELIERPNKMASLSENAKLQAQYFSQGKFEKRFLEIIT